MEITEIKGIHDLKLNVYSLKFNNSIIEKFSVWEKLFSFAKKNDLFHKDIKFYTICYENPLNKYNQDLKYEACLSDISFNNDLKTGIHIEKKELNETNFKIYQFKGEYSKLKDFYKNLFENEESNRNIDHTKPFIEEYLNMDIDPENIITKIWIPLK